jgi:hypothetical protein
MTADEERAFRSLVRETLKRTDEIALVSADQEAGMLEPFTAVAFSGERAWGIIVPAPWATDPAIEAECQAILRQESNALAGQALD